MAELREKYMGTDVFGPRDKKIGTVRGLLIDDDRRQYYVVESRALRRRNRTTYYVPADQGVAAGSQRINLDVPPEQFEERGWTVNPTEAHGNRA